MVEMYPPFTPNVSSVYSKCILGLLAYQLNYSVLIKLQSGEVVWMYARSTIYQLNYCYTN